jgi:heme o synthase
MPQAPNFFESIAALTRPLLSLFVSLSALSVYFYFKGPPSFQAFFLCAGVFLLSCASSAVNQIQEQESDSRMKRTMMRPLPQKQYTARQIFFFSGASGIVGFSLLAWGVRPLSAALAAAAMLLYNGVYTPLKQKTSLALVPGAIAGALPVLIGCAGATGSVGKKAIFIAFFLFLWQMPHFLLLLLRFKEDYRKAGIANWLLQIAPEQLKILIYIWLLAASAMTALFPIAGIVRSVPLLAIIACGNLGIAVVIIKEFRGNTALLSGRVLYAYQGMVFVVLAFQGFLFGHGF